MAGRHIAVLVWDYESWDMLSARLVTLARDAGALMALPIAFASRAGVHLFAGELAEVASLVAQAASVTEAIGSSFAPDGAQTLAAFRGCEADISALIEAATKDAQRGGEGGGLSHVRWVTAMLCNGLGRYEQALAIAQQASEDSPAQQFSIWGLVELIEAAARSGAPGQAAGAFRLLSETTRASGTDWALGTEARSRALVSEGAAAEKLYLEAIDCFGRPACGWTWPAPARCTASGCAASGAGVTPAISLAARTRCSIRSAPQRLPNGRASSCGRPAGTPGSAPSRHQMPLPRKKR